MKARSVVVVEDDSWAASAHARELQRAGFCVHVAPNGLEAMNVIDGMRPDAIVLDMFLTGPNGIVLLHELGSHSDLASIPVIVCTTSAADIPKGSLSAYGVREVLDKTCIQPGDIAAAVKRQLS